MRCHVFAAGCRGGRRKVAAGAAVLLIVVLGGCGGQTAPPAPVGEQVRDGFAVLVFTRTTGFRHASIDDGVAAIRRLGASHGFAVDATEDPEQFRDVVLRRRRLCPTGGTGSHAERSRQSPGRRVHLEGLRAC